MLTTVQFDTSLASSTSDRVLVDLRCKLTPVLRRSQGFFNGQLSVVVIHKNLVEFGVFPLDSNEHIILFLRFGLHRSVGVGEGALLLLEESVREAHGDVELAPLGGVRVGVSQVVVVVKKPDLELNPPAAPGANG